MRLTTQNREDIEQYILRAIDASEDDTCPCTDKERLQFVYDTFKAEYGFNVARVGQQKAFSEWISGLPSTFNIDYVNNEILSKAESWGQPTATETQQYKILDQWFDFITSQTFKLFKKHKVRA